MTTCDVKAQLAPCLKALRLPTVRACYQDESHRARRESLPYERYLLELMERECQTRRQNRIARYLHPPSISFSVPRVCFY